MSDGYEVVMADLLAMARTFGESSRALSTADSGIGGSPPDGGDANINGALTEALHAAKLTTSQLSAVVADHGKKLDASYERYQGAEESTAQLCQQLTSMITGK